jgi:hypothetical protein
MVSIKHGDKGSTRRTYPWLNRIFALAAFVLTYHFWFVGLDSASSTVCNCDNNHDIRNGRNVTASVVAAVTSATNTGLVSTGGEKNFYDIGLKLGTDKVAGKHRLKRCLHASGKLYS